MPTFGEGDFVRVTRGKWKDVHARVTKQMGEFVHVKGEFDGSNLEEKSIGEDWLELVHQADIVPTASEVFEQMVSTTLALDAAHAIPNQQFPTGATVEIRGGFFDRKIATVIRDDGRNTVRVNIRVGLNRCHPESIDRTHIFERHDAQCECPSNE